MNTRTLAIAILIPFTLLTLYAVSQVGYIGIFEYPLHSPAGWQVIADETTSAFEGFVDHLSVDGGIAAQWPGNEGVRIDRLELEFIGEDDAFERSQAMWPGMRIRTADGDNTFAIQCQLVPFEQHVWVGAMPDELRKVGIKDPVQFALEIGFEFAQPVP